MFNESLHGFEGVYEGIPACLPCAAQKMLNESAFAAQVGAYQLGDS